VLPRLRSASLSRANVQAPAGLLDLEDGSEGERSTDGATDNNSDSDHLVSWLHRVSPPMEDESHSRSTRRIRSSAGMPRLPKIGRMTNTGLRFEPYS
jgi:hypothetical protein